MTAFVISNAGGNWNAAASYVANSGFPVAGDTVTATGTSGNLTVNVSSACASIILTNYTGTLTFNNNLTVTSTVTFVSGMNIAGTAAPGLTCNGAATLTSGGKTLTCGLTLQGAVTYTLGDDWTVNGLVTFGNGSNATVLNSNTMNLKGGLTVGTTGAATGTTLLKFTSTGTWTGPASGTLANNVTFAAGANTVTLPGSVIRYTTGTLTYTSGTISVNGSNSFNIAGNCTITTGSGMIFNTVSFVAASTITLGADLYTITMNWGNVACTFAGAFDIYCNAMTNTAITAARVWTLVANQKLTVGPGNGYVSTLAGVASGPSHAKFVSSSPGTKTKIIAAQGAIMNLAYIDATDIDSSLGQSIYTFGGTLTTCFNWQNSFPLYVAPPQAMYIHG